MKSNLISRFTALVLLIVVVSCGGGDRSDSNGNNQGGGSPGFSLITQPQPQPTPVSAAPQNLTVTRSGTNLTITWEAPVGSTSSTTYEVLYCESNLGVSCTPTRTLTTTGRQATYTGTYGKRYTFKVTAESSTGSGNDSHSVEIPYQVSPPLTLTVNQGRVETGASVTVTWTPSPVPVRHYRLTHCLDSVCDTETLSVSSRTRSFTDPGTHTFQVVAVNPGNVASPPSAQQSVEVYVPSRAPTAPRNLTVTRSGADLTIAWDTPADPGTDVVHYTVEYCESDLGVSCTPTRSLTATGRQTTYTGTYGKRYTFKVTAESNAGSNSDARSVEIPYQVPPQLTLTVDQTRVETGTPVTVQWTPSTVPVQHYRLTHCLDGTCDTETLNVTTHTRSFSDPGVHTFQVVAVNPGNVASPSSAQKSVEVYVPPRAPTAPRNLSVTRSGTSLTVTWDTSADSGTDVVRYTVTYCESNLGVSCTPSSSLTASGRQATYTGSYGKRYTFKVTAESSAGSNSDTRSVEIPYQVSPPLTLTVNQGRVETGAPVTVTWSQSTVPVRHYRLTHCLNSVCDTETLSVTSRTRSFSDLGTHTFQVVAVNPGGAASSPSTQQSVEVYVPPRAPTVPRNLTVIRSGTNLTVTWNIPADPGTDTVHYTVEYCESNLGVSCTPTSTLTPTGRQATHTGSYGKRYTFKVTAVSSAGSSSASRSVEIPYQVPPQLTLTVTQGPVETGSPVTLQWTPSTVPVQHYRLTHCLNGTCDTETLSVTTHTRSFTDPGVHTFQVVAVNAGGVAGQPSVLRSVEVVIPPRAPTAPQNLSVTRSGINLTVTWGTPADPGTDVVRYTVQYCESNLGVSCTPTRSLTSTGRQATYTGSYGKRYTFKVTAESNAGSNNDTRFVEIPYQVSPQLTLTVDQGRVETGAPVTVEWTPSTVPVQHYRLTHCLDGTCDAETLNVTSHTRSFTDPGTHTFQVVAVNPGGVASPPSTLKSVEVYIPPPPLSAPENVQVVLAPLLNPEDDQYAIVSWDHPRNNGGSIIVQYRVYSSIYCPVPFSASLDAYIGGSVTEYRRQVTYNYGALPQLCLVVEAINADGDTARSEGVVVTLRLPPEPDPGPCGDHNLNPPDCVPNLSDLHNRSVMIEALEEAGTLLGSEHAVTVDIDGNEEFRFVIIDTNTGLGASNHGNEVLQAACYHRPGNCVTDPNAEEPWYRSVTPENAQQFLHYYDTAGTDISTTEAYRLTTEAQIASISNSWFPEEDDLGDHAWVIRAGRNREYSDPVAPTLVQGYLDILEATKVPLTVTRPNGSGGTMEVEVEVPKLYFITGYAYREDSDTFEPGGSECGRFAEYCIRGPEYVGSIYNPEEEEFFAFTLGNSFAAPAIAMALEATTRLWDLSNAQLFYLLEQCSSIPSHVAQETAREQERAKEIWGLGVLDLGCLADPSDVLTINDELATGSIATAARSLVTLEAIDGIGRDYTLELPGRGLPLTVSHINVSGLRRPLHVSASGTTQLPLLSFSATEQITLLPLFEQEKDGDLANFTGIAFAYREELWNSWIAVSYRTPTTFFGTSPGTGVFDPGLLQEFSVGAQVAYTPRTDTTLSLGLTCTQTHAEGTSVVRELSGIGCAANTGIGVTLGRVRLGFGLNASQVFDSVYRVFDGSEEHRIALNQNPDVTARFSLSVPF